MAAARGIQEVDLNDPTRFKTHLGTLNSTRKTLEENHHIVGNTGRCQAICDVLIGICNEYLPKHPALAYQNLAHAYYSKYKIYLTQKNYIHAKSAIEKTIESYSNLINLIENKVQKEIGQKRLEGFNKELFHLKEIMSESESKSSTTTAAIRAKLTPSRDLFIEAKTAYEQVDAKSKLSDHQQTYDLVIKAILADNHKAKELLADNSKTIRFLNDAERAVFLNNKMHINGDGKEYFKRARILLNNEKFSEAILCFRECLQQHSDNSTLRLQLGIALFQTGAKTEAYREIQIAKWLIRHRFQQVCNLDVDLKQMCEKAFYFAAFGKMEESQKELTHFKEKLQSKVKKLTISKNIKNQIRSIRQGKEYYPVSFLDLFSMLTKDFFQTLYVQSTHDALIGLIDFFYKEEMKLYSKYRLNLNETDFLLDEMVELKQEVKVTPIVRRNEKKFSPLGNTQIVKNKFNFGVNQHIILKLCQLGENYIHNINKLKEAQECLGNALKLCEAGYAFDTLLIKIQLLGRLISLAGEFREKEAITLLINSLEEIKIKFLELYPLNAYVILSNAYCIKGSLETSLTKNSQANAAAIKAYDISHSYCKKILNNMALVRALPQEKARLVLVKIYHLLSEYYTFNGQIQDADNAIFERNRLQALSSDENKSQDKKEHDVTTQYGLLHGFPQNSLENLSDEKTDKTEANGDQTALELFVKAMHIIHAKDHQSYRNAYAYILDACEYENEQENRIHIQKTRQKIIDCYLPHCEKELYLQKYSDDCLEGFRLSSLLIDAKSNFLTDSHAAFNYLAIALQKNSTLIPLYADRAIVCLHLNKNPQDIFDNLTLAIWVARSTVDPLHVAFDLIRLYWLRSRVYLLFKDRENSEKDKKKYIDLIQKIKTLPDRPDINSNYLENKIAFSSDKEFEDAIGKMNRLLCSQALQKLSNQELDLLIEQCEALYTREANPVKSYLTTTFSLSTLPKESKPIKIKKPKAKKGEQAVSDDAQFSVESLKEKFKLALEAARSTFVYRASAKKLNNTDDEKLVTRSENKEIEKKSSTTMISTDKLFVIPQQTKLTISANFMPQVSTTQPVYEQLNLKKLAWKDLKDSNRDQKASLHIEKMKKSGIKYVYEVGGRVAERILDSKYYPKKDRDRLDFDYLADVSYSQLASAFPGCEIKIEVNMNTFGVIHHIIDRENPQDDIQIVTNDYIKARNLSLDSKSRETNLEFYSDGRNIFINKNEEKQILQALETKTINVSDKKGLYEAINKKYNSNKSNAELSFSEDPRRFLRIISRMVKYPTYQFADEVHKAFPVGLSLLATQLESASDNQIMGINKLLYDKFFSYHTLDFYRVLDEQKVIATLFPALKTSINTSAKQKLLEYVIEQIYPLENIYASFLLLQVLDKIDILSLAASANKLHEAMNANPLYRTCLNAKDFLIYWDVLQVLIEKHQEINDTPISSMTRSL